MIPLNKEVTIVRTRVDDWGIGIEDSTDVQQAFVNYRLDLRGNEVNTRNSTLEIVPIGSIFFKGLVQVSQDDNLVFTGHDGKPVTIKPDDIKYILNSGGKVTLTKVSF